MMMLKMALLIIVMIIDDGGDHADSGAGGCDDDCAWLAQKTLTLYRVAEQVVKDSNQKSGRLARARLRFTNRIITPEGVRQNLRLYG